MDPLIVIEVNVDPQDLRSLLKLANTVAVVDNIHLFTKS